MTLFVVNINVLLLIYEQNMYFRFIDSGDKLWKPWVQLLDLLQDLLSPVRFDTIYVYTNNTEFA